MAEVALAESHAQKALEAKSASETSAACHKRILYSHVACNFLRIVRDLTALWLCASCEAQNAENNMATTTNALSAVHNNVRGSCFLQTVVFVFYFCNLFVVVVELLQKLQLSQNGPDHYSGNHHFVKDSVSGTITQNYH